MTVTRNQAIRVLKTISGALCTCLLMVPAMPAKAATVDGRITADDGYTAMHSVSFSLDGGMGMGGMGMGGMGMGGMGMGGGGGITVDGGKLFVKTNAAGNLTHFAVELPTSFVDNSYGANSSNYRGKFDHDFEKLVKSDRIEITIESLAGPDRVFELDYLSETSAGVFASAGLDGDGDQGNLLDGAILNVATSLQYNLQRFGLNANGLDLSEDSPEAVFDNNDASTGNPVSAVDPYFEDWQYALLYEVEVDPGKLFSAPNQFVSVAPTDGHASPSRMPDADSLTTPILALLPMPAASSPSSQHLVPEPQTLAVWSVFALTGVALRRRRAVHAR